MSEKNQDKKELFEKTFGKLLNENETTEEVAEKQEPTPTLEEALYAPEENTQPLSQEQWEKITQNYIPESIGDEQWEAFVSRVPLPPISREDEARAISIGLQEIRKMKEYMLYIHRHMTNEFTRIYASFPLLFSKDFDSVFGSAHKNIVTLMEDMENLIAGDIDQVEAVKSDYKLYQTFEEKRLSILYDLLDHYNNKK